MTHTVNVGEFEGPLGLLLQLVERGNIQVTDIAVASITTAYLERIHQLPDQSPENLSEFVQLGARLLHIKSLALLPGDTAAERTAELDRLNIELSEYRRFQSLARELSRHAVHQTWERPITEVLPAADLPLPRLTLDQLSAAFITAVRRTPPVPKPTIIPRHITLEATMKTLQPQLRTGFTLDQVLATCHNRLEIIVTFLAILEFIRQGLAKTTQTNQFSTITVEATHA